MSNVDIELGEMEKMGESKGNTCVYETKIEIVEDDSIEKLIDSDIYKTVEYETKISYIEINKRYRLKQICLIIPIGGIIMFVLYHNFLLDTWYISIVSFLSSWICFWNFISI